MASVYIIFSFIFYYYFGFYRLFISFFGYFLAIIFVSIKFIKKPIPLVIQLGSICFLCFILTFINSGFDFFSVLFSYRLYLGPLLLLSFFLYFPKIISRQFFLSLALLLSFLTLLERVLLTINSDIVVFNFPQYIYSDKLSTMFEFTYNPFYTTSFFSGVLSFGGSRSITGVCLLALFVLLVLIKAPLFHRLITIFSSLIAGSATSAFIFFVIFSTYLFKETLVAFYDATTFSKIKIYRLFVVIGFSVFIVLASYNLIDKYKGFVNFKFDYLLMVINFKLDIIRDYLSSSSFFGFLFGGEIQLKESAENIKGLGAFHGDFILIDMLARTGLLSILFYAYLILKIRLNYARYPLALMLLGSIHYPILFSGPGQLIFATIASAGLLEIDLKKSLIKSS